MKKIPKILIIAGSDPSGGAGIQADIKTACAYKVYSSAAITCLTAQNTSGVYAIHNSPIDFLHKQIEVLLSDISFDAIKIGMLGNSDIINSVSDILSKRAEKIPLILDTVMVSTSGDLLLEEDAVESLKDKLIKGAYLVTPNVDEAEVLAKMSISNLHDMKMAALEIKALGCKAVLIKGGHINSGKMIRSVLLDEKDILHVISNKRIRKNDVHGTGCTLASAIACNIAKRKNLLNSVRNANKYVARLVAINLDIGEGSRVLKHF